MRYFESETKHREFTTQAQYRPTQRGGRGLAQADPAAVVLAITASRYNDAANMRPNRNAYLLPPVLNSSMVRAHPSVSGSNGTESVYRRLFLWDATLGERESTRGRIGQAP